MRGCKGLLLLAVALAALMGVAFDEIPKASAKALGVTRGKAFSEGLVFVNGKFIPPPYVVERWGTGIRINGKPVTGQVIKWDEFLKTQTGVKVTKTEEVVEAPPPPPPPVAAAAIAPAEEISAATLDALFDDVPVPKKTPAAAPVRAPVVTAPPKPKVTVSYSIDGEFVKNAASDLLVSRLNAARTEIDRLLRAGGFICFGDRYSRVVGDKRTADNLLKKLPSLMQHATSAEAFRSSVRAANLVYLNDMLCDELFENRVDYRKLQERRAQQLKAASYDNILKDVAKPLF